MAAAIKEALGKVAADPIERNDEPRWLSLFRAGATAEEVATAWKEGMSPEERQEADKDGPLARAKFRRAIVDSEAPEVRADAANGFQRVGALLRAADAALGIAPPKTRTRVGGPAASGSGAPNVSRLVSEADGSPGTLALWWSDFGAACNAVQLRERKVTRRINVAAEAVGRLPRTDGIPTDDVAMIDVFDDDEAPYAIATWVVQLREALRLMRGWREEGAVVNVNCQMGKNRSGAVCLVWLCSECGWQVEAAVEHLRNITALGLANPHLVKAVTELLGVEAAIPLNPAGDGGGWVCISPPGTPREGGMESFEESARQAIAQLAGERGDTGVTVGGGQQQDSDDEDIKPLFGEDDLDDVD